MARKILLADDSVTAQNMGRKILADAGYEVITVNNGSAALKKIAEQKPDLIVLDVYMPGYSGLEVCQRLKEAGETARVPVLLTVGKLEPFKPEEARRVRADAFIVKPFEASELLSALSKLEDKIVPRGEASKPGRFARVTASLDEGRYDKSVAIDEDSGWKNRIQFPSKKDKPAQNEGDDAEIYNAMNKDLRTVVERKIAAEPPAAKKEDARVDLGALAPEGLPKDVTPEEIAALAAAAAQVKGKIEESKIEQNKSDQNKTTEAKLAEPVRTESNAEVKTDAQTESKLEPVEIMPASTQAAAVPEQVVLAAPRFEDAKIELKKENAEEVGKKTEEPAPSTDTEKETADAVAPSRADLMVAIAGLEVESVSADSPNSGNGSWANGADRRIADRRTHDERVADEPVTMAVAAGAESAPFVSRWTALSVAVAPEEAALSLELEMQKAYAAFAAAEAGHGIPITETQPVPAEPAAGISSSTEAPTQPPALAVPATPAPEAAHTLTEMASAATDAISAAVKELEAVAESYLAQKAPAPTKPESASLEKAEVAAPASSESATTVLPEVVSALPQPEANIEEMPAGTTEQPASSTLPSEIAAAPEITQSETKAEAPAPLDPSMAVTSEIAAPTLETNLLKQLTSAVEPPASRDWEIAASRNATRVAADLAKDSDIAATTAAAWASWRQIRESAPSASGLSSPAGSQSSALGSSSKAPEEMQRPQDTVAMAVAAGAENHPGESAPESESGIADIVDSVLADLRPKIFEEISRKMGKKK